MSMRYKGAAISATTPTLATDAGASGAWTSQQQMQAKAAGNWAVNGPFFIEDAFSTYLYKGNSSTQTINNGIDLASKGGLVWIKNRTGGPYNHMVFDSTRLPSQYLHTNTTDANQTNIYQLTSFNSNGFTLNDGNFTNNSAATYASWTFRKQPKFFDVVTYTGNGSSLNVSHALTSVPGCVIIKRLNSASDWVVAHRGSGSYWASETLRLNTTAAGVGNGEFNQLTDTYVRVVNSGASYGDVNTNGATYVMYVFAHNAGGFGLTGTDNVISCGSFTTAGNGSATVDLGYEPQWLLYKKTNAADDNWRMQDTFRGMSLTSYNFLASNLSSGESFGGTGLNIPTSTGFNIINAGSAQTYIYIAIRRGPMKVPTDGTKVFALKTYSGSAGNQAITNVGFPPDLFLNNWRANTKGNFEDRLRGVAPYLQSTEIGSEASASTNLVSYDMDGVTLGVNNLNNKDGAAFIGYFFRRASGYFDEVCYTGTGSARTVAHNLTVVPELIILKSRNGGAGREWIIYSSPLGNTKALQFNIYGPNVDIGYWNNTTPSASTFTLGNEPFSNTSGELYVGYLFASVPGVSKIGSYTGNGSSQTIACGFTGGARFVMIKRTDSSGDWYVWDSARGIVAGNDPHLSLNTTAAEVTTDDSVDTASTGFVVNQVAATNVNVNAATYIFLAIA